MGKPVARAIGTALVLLGLVSIVAGTASAQTGAITGVVTDAATGAPLSGVTVRVYNGAGGSVTSASTNASGIYLTSAIAAGSYRVRTSNSWVTSTRRTTTFPASGAARQPGRSLP